jgi:hypothetical protein
MVLLCTLHVCCSHGDEKDFHGAYTAWCQVYNSRLTFLYLLYILGIFHFFVHIDKARSHRQADFFLPCVSSNETNWFKVNHIYRSLEMLFYRVTSHC